MSFDIAFEFITIQFYMLVNIIHESQCQIFDIVFEQSDYYW